MADENIGDGGSSFRADPLNLTSDAMIQMLVLENFQDFARMIKGIMLRFIGDHPLTEDETAIANYINECALAREADDE